MRATGGWQASPAGGRTGAGRWKDATAGRSLAQRLAADGEPVLDVPAKLAARVRVYSRGYGRKTGKHDAVSIGLAALDGTGIMPVARDDVTVSACGCCATGGRSSRRCGPRPWAGCTCCWPS
jgi:hypothetical protein